MALIPKDNIEEIRSRSDIVEVVGSNDSFFYMREGIKVLIIYHLGVDNNYFCIIRGIGSRYPKNDVLDKHRFSAAC